LARSYGMADKERGIPNHENTAFNLASASGPFLPVAVLQTVQQGRLTLADTMDDLLDFGEILAQEQQAITGQPVDPPGGG
jgi:CubicO group peptidase (beta-lactamase class C family)